MGKKTVMNDRYFCEGCKGMNGRWNLEIDTLGGVLSFVVKCVVCNSRASSVIEDRITKFVLNGVKK